MSPREDDQQSLSILSITPSNIQQSSRVAMNLNVMNKFFNELTNEFIFNVKRERGIKSMHFCDQFGEVTICKAKEKVKSLIPIRFL